MKYKKEIERTRLGYKYRRLENYDRSIPQTDRRQHFKPYSMETPQMAILQTTLHGNVPEGSIVIHAPWNRLRWQYCKPHSMETFQKAVL
jgi:hypothetical protein